MVAVPPALFTLLVQEETLLFASLMISESEASNHKFKLLNVELRALGLQVPMR